MDYYLGYILTVLLTIFRTLKNYMRTVILAWKLPGPTALPILGNVLILKNHTELIYLGNHAPNMYGKFFRVWCSILPAIFITEPRHLKQILSTNKNNEKSLFYRAFHNFIGEGLITNNGYKWKKNRKMIQPYFHMNILEKFVDLFTECSSRFVSKLEGEQTVKITPFINDCVLDILHNGVLGVPFDQDSPYRKGQLQAIERFVRPWLLFDSIFDRTNSANYEKKQKHNLHSYTEEVLNNRRQEIKKGTKGTKTCFLDMFIEIADNNSQFTEEDIINEIVTFMLAGQDSVGATIAFSMYYLAKYPEIQDKVLKEISGIDATQKISIKELNEMKYLEQVVKETLRLTPAVPIITRVLTEDVTLDETVFPNGTIIFISPFMTQRLPHVFPDPNTFNPDRFEESNLENIHPYAFLPFSLGPRNCIGYKFAMIEVKTVLFYVLKKFQLSPAKGKEELSLSYRATIRASGGIWVNLKHRKS
ncbi:probable cytochrome P450 4aa1 [Diabrotica virgifera virgifera]|uniref:Probable cytochrome P450 4aa1 n=1 Tax=Diabrotica virgifera virgifera TaxID=50390 RepID=A0A6P7FDP7_DIAVI|nr:probable cytochrome P450 4aa1 [Diabrotica virgifera virgifera]XP_028133800.1 probable cytochrome P450 4aa1 [Diabrotica virgifera virgifera]XP_028133801.1 probable cytochrome P450 4aa1 [Diabrotica virgifera virgifera]KAI2474030.1 hypothetical protein C4B38_000112 [Diabrotica virgifera virgifera]